MGGRYEETGKFSFLCTGEEKKKVAVIELIRFPQRRNGGERTKYRSVKKQKQNSQKYLHKFLSQEVTDGVLFLKRFVNTGGTFPK